MQLKIDDDLDEFRAGLVAWLDDNQPTATEMASEPHLSTGHIPAWGRKWQRRLFDAGWLVPGWPPELGGRNATPREQMVFFEELATRGLKRSLSTTGVPIVAPAIVEYGSPAQVEQWALPLLKGDASSCLGMSEPGAGSDLGGLTTRAERVGDQFVINGQKVWTSGAQHADVCMCYVRTDPSAPKHGGISVLLVDMTTPGITCRPLPNLLDPSRADFNEVFFDDVVVPADALLGELNHGWAVATASLAHERSMVWIAQFADLRAELAEVLSGIEATGGDPVLLHRAAGHYIDSQALRVLGYRAFVKLERGHAAPEQSLLKLFGTESSQRLRKTALDVAGTRWMDMDLADVPDAGPRAISGAMRKYLYSFSQTIAAGTSEIQRNIIGERILGLPRL